MPNALYVEIHVDGALRYLPAEGHELCADLAEAHQYHTRARAELAAQIALTIHKRLGSVIEMPVPPARLGNPAAPAGAPQRAAAGSPLPRLQMAACHDC